MSFVQPKRSAARSTAGIGVAVVFHIVLLWALMNGLGRQVMQVISAPIETRIIEEVKPPPPPPPPPKVIELPLPPKFAPPPPAFVPPVEVKIQAPLSPQPTITATVEPPPPAPVVAQRAEPPPAPPVVQRAEPAPAPAPVKAPAPVSASVACANYGKVMGDAGFPREALRAGLEEGSALIQFTLTANGEIKDIKAVEASHGTFARGAMRIVGEYQCAGQGRDIVVQVPFKFRSN